MDDEILHWAEAQARFYQVLTNPRRVLILHALTEGEKSVSEIAALVCTSLQNTSQHLRLMKDRGLLDSRRDGQTIYYCVTNQKILDNLGFPKCEKKP